LLSKQVFLLSKYAKTESLFKTFFLPGGRRLSNMIRYFYYRNMQSLLILFTVVGPVAHVGLVSNDWAA
jgi:hypothetical protein